MASSPSPAPVPNASVSKRGRGSTGSKRASLDSSIVSELAALSTARRGWCARGAPRRGAPQRGARGVRARLVRLPQLHGSGYGHDRGGGLSPPLEQQAPHGAPGLAVLRRLRQPQNRSADDAPSHPAVPAAPLCGRPWAFPCSLAVRSPKDAPGYLPAAPVGGYSVVVRRRPRPGVVTRTPDRRPAR
jgi:hypothetical protein